MSAMNVCENFKQDSQSRSFMGWGFVALAVLFQLASAQTTFAGAQEFLTKSFVLAVTLTLVIQAGLVCSGERVVEILSGIQKHRTSIMPAFLLLILTLSTSVIFSGFGFFKHYAYVEGNRASEFASTAAQVRQTASELDKYRIDALTFASRKRKYFEDERRRQEARANSNKLNVRSRGVARSRRDQLSREINAFTRLESTLGEVNVVASASEATPEQMRRSLLDARNKITHDLAQTVPDYLNEHPIPGDIPSAVAPTDVQSAFKRDLELRRPPAVFSLAIASAIDLASLLCLLCNLYVSPTEDRILSVKRKMKRMWKATLPLGDTHDSFTVVRMRLQGLKEPSEFQVIFKKPDWAVLGSDLDANRVTISETLTQRLDEQIVVGSFYTRSGQRIIQERPLFEQLEDDRIVYLRLVQAADSHWPEVIADDVTN